MYATHGETFADADDVLWWSKGGKLRGQSVERIRFMKSITEEDREAGLSSNKPDGWGKHLSGGSFEAGMLVYFGTHQPAKWDIEFPDESDYKIELIDPWEMSVEPMSAVFRGGCTIELPGKPRLALRIIRTNVR